MFSLHFTVCTIAPAESYTAVYREAHTNSLWVAAKVTKLCKEICFLDRMQRTLKLLL